MTSTLVLALASGGLVGFSLGLVGGGGSILATPLLLYVVGVANPHVAIGTGALAVSINAYANLLAHARKGHVRWLCAAVVGVLMLRPRGVGRGEERPVDRRTCVLTAAAALATGMASGFFGIGGGFLIVPALVIATGMPMINAIGSSLLGVGTFGLATALNYARSGLVDWVIAGQFISGGVLGGILGMLLATRLSAGKATLNRIFAALILTVATYVIFMNLPATIASG